MDFSDSTSYTSFCDGSSKLDNKGLMA